MIRAVNDACLFARLTDRLHRDHRTSVRRFLSDYLRLDVTQQCGAVFEQENQIVAAFTFEIRQDSRRGLYLKEFCGDLAYYGSENFLQSLDKFAKAYQCSYIEFIGRVGWKRILKGRYKPIRMTYRREL